MKVGRVMAWAAVALLAGVTVVACKASGEVKAEGRIPLPGDADVKFEVKLNTGGDTFSADNTSSKCFRLEFLDANGRELTSFTISPGSNSNVVPTGAVMWRAIQIPCPPPASGPAGSSESDVGASAVGASAAADESHVERAPRRVFVDLAVFGAPLYLHRASLTHNAMYSFVVRCVDADAASEIVRDALDDPIGAAVDPAITIVSYLKAREGVASAAVIGISRQPFTRFDIDVNGRASYATLASAAVQALTPGGVYVAEAHVALLDIRGYGQWNRLVVASEAPGSGVQVSEIAMIHDP